MEPQETPEFVDVSLTMDQCRWLEQHLRNIVDDAFWGRRGLVTPQEKLSERIAGELLALLRDARGVGDMLRRKEPHGIVGPRRY